jgi:hypothetical protein
VNDSNILLPCCLLSCPSLSLSLSVRASVSISLAMTTERPSSPGPSKRPSKWDAEDEQVDHPFPAEAPAIKRRLVRPKKLRRPGDNIVEESSPGFAGPSCSPRRSASPQLRRSPSPSPETSEIPPPVIPSESLSPTPSLRSRASPVCSPTSTPLSVRVQLHSPQSHRGGHLWRRLPRKV